MEFKMILNLKIIIFIVLLVILTSGCTTIVPQNYEGLIETLGKYTKTVKAGLTFKIPFFQRVKKVSMALQPLEISRYSIITKDNAEISTSLTLNYQVTNSFKYFYNNTDSETSMVQLVRGHLRDIIGRMDLNDALGSTSAINNELSKAIGDLTDIYGISVIRINVDELLPSKQIQAAMDKQLTADREKTATIAKAEGEAENIRLTTKANNDALIATAKAKAEAIKTEADAEAYRINKLQETLSQASEGYFRNQSIVAFTKLSAGNNNMIVMDKENIDKIGDIPAIKKIWDQDKN